MTTQLQHTNRPAWAPTHLWQLAWGPTLRSRSWDSAPLYLIAWVADDLPMGMATVCGWQWCRPCAFKPLARED
jgi:hypothetical protein